MLNDISERFNKWIANIHWLDQCLISKSMTLHNLTTFESSIYVFCDASESAYASCTFVRTGNGQKVDVQLLGAKPRIALPIQIAIPRLELLAALFGSRLYTSRGA